MKKPLPDHYRTLQVVPEAEPEVVRAAYRALSGRHHPDVVGGSDARMRQLNEAWTVLRDPTLRREYDRKRALAAIVPADPSPGHQPAPPAPQGGTGSVLDFGRYTGWTLGALSRHDPDYLRWLIRTSIGRRFTAEVESLLEARAPVPVTERREPQRRGLSLRRSVVSQR
jgi:curved DNA-binding protein CbpA